MRALTLILSDLYLPAGAAAPQVSTPTLDVLRRYGSQLPLRGGWRAWLAREVGREDLAALAPAVIAAQLAAAPVAPATAAWLATPVHLQAAMDHVRMGSRAVLAPDAADSARLAADFARAFAGSGFALQPLGGAWLLTGLPACPVETVEPARILGADIGPHLPRGPQARALRSFGAELEMWLHGHALNAERGARREPPLSTLWLWGGGEGTALRRRHVLPAAAGEDPVLRGLWRASGEDELAPPAPDFRAQASQVCEAARRGAGQASHCVVELALFREAAPVAGLAALEERWLAPAALALRRGELRLLRVVANDALHVLRARDRLRFWRRARPFIAAAP